MTTILVRTLALQKGVPIHVAVSQGGAGGPLLDAQALLDAPEAVAALAGRIRKAERPLIICGPQYDSALAAPLANLAATMGADRVVTVAGTHGKSTTTSMVAVLLKEAGLDPSFAIGANVPASRHRPPFLLDEPDVVRDVRRDPLQQDFQGQRPVT